MSRANEGDNWQARDPPVEQHTAQPDVIQSRGHGHPEGPPTRTRPFVPRITAPPFFPRSATAAMGYVSEWSQPRHVQSIFALPTISPTTPLPPPPQLMAPSLGPPPIMPFNTYNVFRGFSARAANGQELQVIQSRIPQLPHYHAHYQRHANGHFNAQGYTHAPGPFPAQDYTHAPGPFPAQGYTHTPMIPFNAEPMTRDEGTRTVQRLRRPRQNPMAQTWKNAGFCTFCRNSGESEEVYRSHLLKVRRPILEGTALSILRLGDRGSFCSPRGMIPRARARANVKTQPSDLYLRKYGNGNMATCSLKNSGRCQFINVYFTIRFVFG